MMPVPGIPDSLSLQIDREQKNARYLIDRGAELERLCTHNNISVQDAAEVVGVSVRTLGRYMRGVPPSTRHGKKPTIDDIWLQLSAHLAARRHH